MLAVQMRRPGHGFPPPGPWPYWDDLAGESISMVDEIHSKLASKRQDMAPYHVTRLQDAGLTSAGRLPPAPAAMSSAAGYESPSENEGLMRRRLPGGIRPQDFNRPKPVVQAQEVIVGRPIDQLSRPPAQLGFDETGGMSAAAYESPQEEYHSAGGGGGRRCLTSPPAPRRNRLRRRGQGTQAQKIQEPNHSF